VFISAFLVSAYVALLSIAPERCRLFQQRMMLSAQPVKLPGNLR